MNYYQVPLTNDPNQSFVCTIPLKGKNITLRFKVRYNTIGDFWWITISDKENNILIDSLPLLAGGNILGQHKHLDIGSAFIINTGDSTVDSPSQDNLGTSFQLIWGDE